MAPPLPNAAQVARDLARLSGDDPDAPDPVPLMAEVDALLAAHQDIVYATCLKYVGRPELAIELAQDTMLKAYRKLPTFRGDSKFTTWLIGIARYECLNARRRKGDALTEDGVVDDTDTTHSVLVSLRRREREDLLRDAAAAALDPLEQEVVYLRYVENLPLPAIEDLVPIEGASGARGVLQRCKRKLGREVRSRLADMGHGSSFVRGSIDR